MLRGALFLFIAIPILEIWLLIRVGDAIGGLETILLVVATAVIGVHLVRGEGLRTASELQARLSGQGDPGSPLEPMVEGVMLLVAGALLLTPGFFTDAIGFTLAFPVTRKPLRQWLLGRVAASQAMGGGGGFPGAPGFDGIIEGDYRREPDDRPGERPSDR